MSLTKDPIENSIQENLGFPKATSTRPVESILKAIKTSLAIGEDVPISGFGMFSEAMTRVDFFNTLEGKTENRPEDELM